MIFVLNELWKKQYCKYLKKRNRYLVENFYEISSVFYPSKKKIQIHEELFDLSIFFLIEPPLMFDDHYMKEQM